MDEQEERWLDTDTWHDFTFERRGRCNCSRCYTDWITSTGIYAGYHDGEHDIEWVTDRFFRIKRK